MTIRDKNQLEELRKNCELRVRAYSLEGGPGETLKNHTQKIAEYLGNPRLRGPLFTLTQEFAANGLKAVYKTIYYDFFVKELGFAEIGYEDWLKLFRTEIESHRAENFERAARDKDLGIDVTFTVDEDYLHITIENPGTPTEIEMTRINRSLAEARKLVNLQHVFIDEQEDDDSQHEGAGLGLPLLIISLRGLGAHVESLSLRAEGNRTIAKIDLAWNVIFTGRKIETEISDAEADQDMTLFSIHGQLLTGGRNILSQIGYFSHEFTGLADFPGNFRGEVFEAMNGIRFRENMHYILSLNDEIWLLHLNFNRLSEVIIRWQPLHMDLTDINMPLDELLADYVNLKKFRQPSAAFFQDIAEGKAGRNHTLLYFALETENRDSRESSKILTGIARFILVTMERNRGILLEHFHGKFLFTFRKPVDALRCAFECSQLVKMTGQIRKTHGGSGVTSRCAVDTGEISAQLLSGRSLNQISWNTDIFSRLKAMASATRTHVTVGEKIFRDFSKMLHLHKKYLLRLPGENKLSIFSISRFEPEKGLDTTIDLASLDHGDRSDSFPPGGSV